VPVTVVTGFLGSGKTTLINRALRDPALARALVIVNEFGAIGIDHALIAHSRDAVLLLENGCLCCAVRGDLIDALARLHERRNRVPEAWFDRVVIETSGLAEPASLADMLDSVPRLAACYALAGFVVTVDAVNGEATLEAHDVALRQVALADRLVVTKTDLLPEADRARSLAALERRIRALNPAAHWQPAAEGAAACLEAAAAGAARGPDVLAGALPHSHDAGRIRQFCLVRDEPIDDDALAMFLESLERAAGPNLLRVKGLLNLASRPDRPAVLHGAQKLVHRLEWLERWPDADRRSRIVFLTVDVPAAEVAEMLDLAERLVRGARAARQRAAGAAPGTQR
jgi:G3E family GTPase